MPRRKRKSPRKSGKRSRARLAAFFAFTAVIFAAAAFLGLVDKRLLPAVIKIEEYRLAQKLNEAIDSAMQDFSGGGLTSSDFYDVSTDAAGRVTSLSADTILINEVCASLSRFMDIYFTKQVSDQVFVPIGALLGIEWLANAGPSYKITVMPVGSANVDYETSFVAAGINQINFQVWLTINLRMQVANPLQIQEITVSRRIPLVNAVFAGEIPEVFLSPRN